MKDEILKFNPDFEENFRNLLCFDDFKYFYHVTNCNGDDICNEGLYLMEKRLDSTTIEIPKEFIKNPIDYCLNEMGENYRQNPNIVLLGIPEDEIDFVIEKNYQIPKNWTLEELPKYNINSNYIIGYINTNTFEIIINENYEYANEFYL